MINTGMLAAINNDCNGARIAADMLDDKPNNAINNVPAHVGHPVNNPMLAPIPARLAFLDLLL